MCRLWVLLPLGISSDDIRLCKVGGCLGEVDLATEMGKGGPEGVVGKAERVVPKQRQPDRFERSSYGYSSPPHVAGTYLYIVVHMALTARAGYCSCRPKSCSMMSIEHGSPLERETEHAYRSPLCRSAAPGGGQRSLTFEEIAALQGVGPIDDPNELVGGWPGEVDDCFEEAVLAWRRNEPWPQK